MSRIQVLYATIRTRSFPGDGIVGLAVLLFALAVPASVGTASPRATSAPGPESIDIESVVSGKDLWVHEAAGEKERHFCGSRAIAAGREVPIPFPKPQVVKMKASEEEGLLYWLATMIDP
jgi:hypothetical protein